MFQIIKKCEDKKIIEKSKERFEKQNEHYVSQIVQIIGAKNDEVNQIETVFASFGIEYLHMGRELYFLEITNHDEDFVKSVKSRLDKKSEELKISIFQYINSLNISNQDTEDIESILLNIASISFSIGVLDCQLGKQMSIDNISLIKP